MNAAHPSVNAATQFPSEKRGELLAAHFAVTEDRGEKTGADDFARVNWNDRSTAIRVTQEVMTSLDSYDLESGLPQGRNEFAARDTRQSSHATVIFWTPMKSSGSMLSP